MFSGTKYNINKLIYSIVVWNGNETETVHRTSATAYRRQS